MSFNLQRTFEDLLKPPTHLQKLIDQACSVDRTRPDLSLNLEICDYVNRKKANNPHEAVFSLLPYINSRIPKQALIALNLLDNLVKNCGHAVHYQIASKDFLNQLVRRFPEFQPSTSNPVQQKILEMLQEWRFSLCENSRYKEDLTKIKDMCNLLQRKHWRLPKPSSNNTAVILGPQNTIRSQSELENEDLEAMQAKLQELLRRATPHDLREANKLVKIITGYERSSNKYDYDKQFSDELDALETKVELLKEMISVLEVGEYLDETGMSLLSACISNVNKIRQLTANYKDALETLEVDGTQEDSEEYCKFSSTTISSHPPQPYFFYFYLNCLAILYYPSKYLLLTSQNIYHSIAHLYNRLHNLHSSLIEVIQANNDLENGIKPVFKESDDSDQFLIQLGDNDDDLNSNQNGNADLISSPSNQNEKKNPLNDLLGLDFNTNPVVSTINKANSQPFNLQPTNAPMWNQSGSLQNLSGMTSTPTPSQTQQMPSTSTSTSAFNHPAPTPATSLYAPKAQKAPAKPKDLFDFSDMMNTSVLSAKSAPSSQPKQPSTNLQATNQTHQNASSLNTSNQDTDSLIDL
ncbi:putative ADP-ribosylation factor-binding protein [Smittium culicis]|uniref:Putative ADP-ribosylation factor-binding protein n=1 Tax=Smittium culicis TaxID=133412 RepID=A0A1R1X063_9FUNG|nr:putative ADP-ribosylation factor-binding protein [Smittium culicis]